MVRTECGWVPWGWRQLTCGLCGRRYSAERAVESWWSSREDVFNTLQVFVVHSSGAALPHGDEAGQGALTNTAVEAAEDLRQHTNFLSLLRKYSHCWALLTSCVVSKWGPRWWRCHIFKAACPLHFKLSTVTDEISSPSSRQDKQLPNTKATTSRLAWDKPGQQPQAISF